MEETKTCPVCGAPVEIDARFCGKCGYSFSTPPPIYQQIPTKYETKVFFYRSDRKAQKEIMKMEKLGWEVIDTEAIEQGYGCFKTGCLGCLFLPLALLGKKPHHIKVTFRKPISYNKQQG